MVGGQLLDLEAEGRPIGIAELQEIHRLKTAALFEASLRIGGVAAQAEAAIVDALGEFGRLLGHAFQITDDVLDETGETAVLGKTAGTDRQREKATYPGLLGVSSAREFAERAAAEASEVLERAGIHDPQLRALVRFAAERDR